MADIKKVTTGSHRRKDGFVITWEMSGISKAGAELRAIAQTAMRFPTTITTAEVVGFRELGERGFDVDVFVPTDGFASAGISSPVGWVKDNFGDRFNR